MTTRTCKCGRELVANEHLCPACAEADFAWRQQVHIGIGTVLFALPLLFLGKGIFDPKA